MDQDLKSGHFREDLLRLYLGKYESRFKPLPNRSGTVLHTDPYPILVVQLSDVWISLAEYIEIEKDDANYGAFDYYQIDIIAVPIEDPEGVKKIEIAIAKSFLAGTQS
jgi:hypothetical protein